MNYLQFKQAAKTHYDKTPGHPKDQPINTAYYEKYFSNFGAGDSANNILREDFDRQGDDLIDQEQALDWSGANAFNPETIKEQAAITNQLSALSRRRHARLNAMSPLIDKANNFGIGIGALAGVGGAGLTYAGLGFIPSLKRKRILRAIMAAAAGLPIGYVAADQSSKAIFNHYNKKAQ